LNRLFAIILGISLTANIILGFLYAGQRTMMAEVKDSNLHESKPDSKKEVANNEKLPVSAHAALEGSRHSEEIKSFIDDTFRKLFDYGNKNYTTRFDQVKGRLAEPVASKLKTSADSGSPQITFKNDVKHMNIYINAITERKATALVNMETQYSAGDSAFPNKNQIYEVSVVRNQHRWLIERLELMGTFEPFEEN
jgi:hypothetical protein